MTSFAGQGSYPVLLRMTVVALLWSIHLVSSTNCTHHGCALVPRDVSFDDAARKALQKIRRYHDQQDSGMSRSEPPEEYTAALEELAACHGKGMLALTLIGFKGGAMGAQINQDRALVISPYRMKLNIGDGDETTLAQIVGVFDGHANGGEEVSEYARQEVPRRLASKLEQAAELSDEVVRNALNDTFWEVDQSIPNDEGGSTASIVVRIGRKLYVANVGDSISIISVCVRGAVHVAYKTKEHKLEDPAENLRIASNGGYIWNPPDPVSDVSRVMWKDPETGNLEGGLAMTRAIGDSDGSMIIAEPTVDFLDIHELVSNALDGRHKTCPDDERTGMCTLPATKADVQIVAISVTDGISDMIEASDVAEALGCAFSEDAHDPHPLIQAEELVLRAAMKWNQQLDGQYRDDISVAATTIPIEAHDII